MPLFVPTNIAAYAMDLHEDALRLVDDGMAGGAPAARGQGVTS